MSRQPAFKDFDPNDVNRAYALWAVYSGGSRFKTYTSRGPALNGFASNHQAKLYEFVPGTGWVERAVKDPENASDACDNCHLSIKESFHGSWSYDSAWQWQRQGGKILSPPVLLHLCNPCARQAAHA